MAGLLDIGAAQPAGGLLGDLFNDPGARLGMSLLAASSPKLRGLGVAMAQQDQARQQAMQQQLMQSQIAENAAQAKMREQQFGLAQQKQNMLAGLFGGGGSPLAGVSTGGGVNMQPSGGNGLGSMSLDKIAALKANGIDLMDAWKIAQQGLKQDAGAYYKMPDGTIAYMPQLDKGMGVIGGQAAAVPGYSQANAAIKGAETAAVEVAKYPYAVGTDAARQTLSARLDPIKTYNSQTGREEFVPRSAVAQPQYSGAGYNGGSAAAAAPEQLQILQSELGKLPPNHPDRPALMREMQRLGGGQAMQQPGSYAAGPSAAEAAANEARKVQAVEQVKADISPTATKIGAVDAARDALGMINQALTHPGLKTATGIQGTVDPRNYIAGTDATNFRVLMDQVKGSVFLDAYKDLRGGGAITDVEGAKAEAAKARINRAQSPDEFVKGLNEYKAIVERGLARAQERAGNQGGASGNWGDQAKPGKTVVKTGMYGGKRVVQYSDGSVDYAN